MNKIYLFAAVCLLFISCSGHQINENSSESVSIYPDYCGVTVPYNIAPLNFMPEGIEKGFVRFSSEGGDVLDVPVRGGRTRISTGKWHEFMSDVKGASVDVTVVDAAGKAYVPFSIEVAEDPSDRYVAYRLIDPGYKLWGEMGIWQRDLETFRQTAIVESRKINDACVNCHSFANRDPETMLLHVRTTEYGGTYVSVDGETEKLDTKTPQTISALVYPSWHPSGKYVAFSVNDTKQTFHVSDPNKIEVYDFRSDVVVYDVEKRKLITSKPIFSADAFETFPAFSNDGSRLFYCSADSLKMPTRYKELQYSLCSIGFDEKTGSFGQVDTLVKAGKESVTMPRVSPDGRYLLYTSTAYGNFTVWHKDAELVLIDLQTGEKRVAADWNSEDAESFHSWSGNSRWVVFSSRRDDGEHTRLYLGYIGEDGTLGKAFMLPQKDPRQNKRFMKSYNIPEFVSGKVKSKGYDIRNASGSYKVEFSGNVARVASDAVTGASVGSVN